mmetsp:Transcript_31335/g.105519  ORF Transcript_31335/g.105519 Transcript_31335/m.105519 type:complete len:297 (-) Transcript_31335:812-1702(-)
MSVRHAFVLASEWRTIAQTRRVRASAPRASVPRTWTTPSSTVRGRMSLMSQILQSAAAQTCFTAATVDVDSETKALTTRSMYMYCFSTHVRLNSPREHNSDSSSCWFISDTKAMTMPSSTSLPSMPLTTVKFTKAKPQSRATPESRAAAPSSEITGTAECFTSWAHRIACCAMFRSAAAQARRTSAESSFERAMVAGTAPSSARRWAFSARSDHFAIECAQCSFASCSLRRCASLCESPAVGGGDVAAAARTSESPSAAAAPPKSDVDDDTTLPRARRLTRSSSHWSMSSNVIWRD